MTSEDLYKDVKIIKDNQFYNVSDILLGTIPGTTTPMSENWLENRLRIKKDKKYKDTILGIYFNHESIDVYKPSYKPHILKLSILKYNEIKKPVLPNKDELVVYIRTGDVVLPECKYRHGDPLNFNFIENIKKNLKDINKITIVTCQSFSSFRSVATFTKKRLEYNKNKFLPILDNIINNFSDYNLSIHCNIDVDRDICFLNKNGFIGNPNCSWYKLFNI